MSYIENEAKNLVRLRFRPSGLGDVNKVLDKIHQDLSDMYSDTDKIKYLTIVLEGNDVAYDKHLIDCTNKSGCQTNKGFEKVNYFLQQELDRLGVQMNDDTFTREEKSIIVEQLDKILEDLRDLKDGQEILFQEIDELKQWFILGKKNWRQLAIGKIGEMVAGEVISQAAAKPLQNLFREGLRLIGQ